MLPAGPTVIDMMANSAFYYGLLRTLSEEDRPLWTKLSFAAAEHNFTAAARDGIEARLYWPGLGEVTADELTLRRLRRWPTRGCAAGAWPARCATASRGDRRPGQDRPQRRHLAGRHGARAAAQRPVAAPRSGRDAAAVLRADAQQRTRAHLGRAALS